MGNTEENGDKLNSISNDILDKIKNEKDIKQREDWIILFIWFNMGAIIKVATHVLKKDGDKTILPVNIRTTIGNTCKNAEDAMTFYKDITQNIYENSNENEVNRRGYTLEIISEIWNLINDEIISKGFENYINKNDLIKDIQAVIRKKQNSGLAPGYHDDVMSDPRVKLGMWKPNTGVKYKAKGIKFEERVNKFQNIDNISDNETGFSMPKDIDVKHIDRDILYKLAESLGHSREEVDYKLRNSISDNIDIESEEKQIDEVIKFLGKLSEIYKEILYNNWPKDAKFEGVGHVWEFYDKYYNDGEFKYKKEKTLAEELKGKYNEKITEDDVKAISKHDASEEEDSAEEQRKGDFYLAKAYLFSLDQIEKREE